VGTQESCHQTQSPTHSAVDPKSRAYKSLDQLAREFVAGNQKIARELGRLAPERNSCKAQNLKRRTKTRIDGCYRLNKIVNRTAIRANAGDKEAKAVLPALLRAIRAGARCTILRMKRPEYPRRSMGNVTWRWAV